MSRRRDRGRRERRRAAEAAARTASSTSGEPATTAGTVPPATVTGRSTPPATAGQRQALEELVALAESGDALRVYQPRGPIGPDGRIEVEISLRCAGMERHADGVALHARERVTVVLPAEVPLQPPAVRVAHRRFRDVPHVVWGELCLYRSPGIEWDHADGMFGFITRLADWFRHAATGQLDPDGQPLHPPFAWADPREGLIVVRAEAPEPSEELWRGAAVLRRVHPRRHELLGWHRLGERWPRTAAEARVAAGLDPDDDAEIVFAPALIAPRALGRGTYPDTAWDLLAAFNDRWTPRWSLLLINRVLARNRELAATPAQPPTSTRAEPPPARELPAVIVGDPTRGVAGAEGRRVANLVAWSIPGTAEQMARLAPYLAARADVATRAAEVLEIGREYLAALPTRWITVDDARGTVTTRRDAATPATWLTGKRILVLGAGALGAPIAEMCARGGAARITVVDQGSVRAGTLVRQIYTDADLGEPKATALARRLRACRPDLTVVAHVDNAATYLRGPAADLDHDLIIDATAHRGVRASLERERRIRRDQWPPHVTVLIGPTAARGIATVSAAGASGGGFDVLRRVGLAAHAATDPERGEPADEPDGFAGAEQVVEDFFPRSAPALFTPEPGCGDATFVGSAADTTALAGQLFTGVLAALTVPATPMAALIVHTPAVPTDPPPPGPRWLTFDDDALVTESSGYEVRLRPDARAAMDTEIRDYATVRPSDVETGGRLFGAIDHALGVIWIDQATEPPPDSTMSTVGFSHDRSGLAQLTTKSEQRSNHISTFLGKWHTHPFSGAEPSPTDRATMTQLVGDLDTGPRQALLLVLGGQHWQLYLDGTREPDLRALLVTRPASATAAPEPGTGRPAGGWPRATWWTPTGTTYDAGPPSSADDPREPTR